MSSLRADTETTLFPPIIMDPEVRVKEDSFKAAREQYLLVTHGAHVFDRIRYLAGDVSRLSARVACAGDDYTWHGTGRRAQDAGLISFEISASVATVPAFGDQNAFERQLEAFARSIAQDTDTTPNGLDGLAAMRFLQAVADSIAADGTEVAL